MRPTVIDNNQSLSSDLLAVHADGADERLNLLGVSQILERAGRACLRQRCAEIFLARLLG